MPNRPSLRTYTVAIVFASAALQGLSVVALPASATELHRTHGLSAADYGGLFVPQTIGALVGAMVGPALAGWSGLHRTLAIATAFHGLGQLAISLVGGPSTALACWVAAACLGLGFGLGAVPLNTIPRRLWRRADGAVVGVHTAIGFGFALGPWIVGRLSELEIWWAYPSTLAGLALALAVAGSTIVVPKEQALEVPEATKISGSTKVMLVLLAIAYAFAEGTFANWATVFLHEDRGLAPSQAGLALSAFWAALAFGRLCVAWLSTRVSILALWTALPIAMASVFVALPHVEGPASGVAAYAAAGLATSAFFPLTIALASRRLGVPAENASALLTAALMSGVGAASFVVGALRDALGFDVLFTFSALEPLAALGLGLLLFRGRPPLHEDHRS